MFQVETLSSLNTSRSLAVHWGVAVATFLYFAIIAHFGLPLDFSLPPTGSINHVNSSGSSPDQDWHQEVHRHHPSPLHVICGHLILIETFSKIEPWRKSKIKIGTYHKTVIISSKQLVETSNFSIPRIPSSCICIIENFQSARFKSMWEWLPAIAIKENKKPNNITANNLSPDHKALAGGCQQLALRPWPVVQVCLCCRTKLVSWPLDGFATTSIRLVPSSSRPDPGPTPRTYL